MSLLFTCAGIVLSVVFTLAPVPGAAGAEPVQRPESQKPETASPRKADDRQKQGTAVPRTAPRQPTARPRTQPPPPHPVHRPPVVTVRGRIFIGGYFYDPYFGPYPWWRYPDYPYWYFPVYDQRAELRIKVTPDAGRFAAVYVDGFYAGVVDDFDGVFQSLALPPGGHTLAIFLEGYRTVRHNLYLQPGSRFTLRSMLQRLAPGERSERPEVAPPIPPPPAGSYSMPSTSPAIEPPRAPVARASVGHGALDLYVQPVDAEVTIDGQPWVSSAAGHFVVQLTAGPHRLEVARQGYRSFAGRVEIVEGEETPLNVSLTRAP